MRHSVGETFGHGRFFGDALDGESLDIRGGEGKQLPGQQYGFRLVLAPVLHAGIQGDQDAENHEENQALAEFHW